MPAERVDRFDPHARSRRQIVRLSDEFMWQEPVTDDAYTARWRGASYVCPRYPRLRMLEGVLAFRSSHPGSALASEPAVRWAADELARIRHERPAARSYILTAPWHVPLRWFAAFDPSEREMYERPDGTVSIRYRTGVAEAAGRVERAVEILDDAGFGDGVVEDVRRLAHWLREFAGDGMLELDYDGVAELFPDGELAFDESAADVWSSLQALERLDYDEAGVSYAEVASRWAPAQALAYVN
jgi:hypothetical protein